MISNDNLFKLLSRSALVKTIYDTEMDKIALNNDGKYKLDEKTQLEIANKAFNVALKESTINTTWQECCAIFDIMDRNL